MENISNVWKWIATLLAGVVIGGVPLFVTTASKVDASQVRDIVNRESPYNADKQLIFFKLDQTYSLIKQIQGQLEQIQIDLNSITSFEKVAPK